MGILAVSVSSLFGHNLWNGELIIEALKAPVMIGSLPIGIFQVVLIFGLLIHFFTGRSIEPLIPWLKNLCQILYLDADCGIRSYFQYHFGDCQFGDIVGIAARCQLPGTTASK